MKKNVCASIAGGVAVLAVMTWAPLGEIAHAQGYAAPAVFQAAGPTAASIQGTVDRSAVPRYAASPIPSFGQK